MVNLKNKNQLSHCIVIEGELTIYTAMELKSKLLVDLSMTEELELDLSKTDEIDAAGLQLLVMIKQEATAIGKVVRVTGHSTVVLKLLELSGLASFFGDPLLIVDSSIVEGKST
jgi:anti-anti-sigma factor